MSSTKLYTGWQTIAGYRVYCEDGLVTRLSYGDRLYYWNDKYGKWINLLPCKPSRIRYYARVGKLGWH